MGRSADYSLISGFPPRESPRESVGGIEFLTKTIVRNRRWLGLRKGSPAVDSQMMEFPEKSKETARH
ncbi:hypothetical protein TNIN_456301 [Trichonephila inaurata madagascariensis]|uniref:Uncharacterized protein n=1 Tax=Trichonephila inaurata madagascariensis TaxID=2747483 RepID=A0A8X6YN09_9ARAC|nr:hypothetical protein TNIN_456301 [Trichonephila inaurata madagascariensis]